MHRRRLEEAQPGLSTEMEPGLGRIPRLRPTLAQLTRLSGSLKEQAPGSLSFL